MIGAFIPYINDTGPKCHACTSFVKMKPDALVFFRCGDQRFVKFRSGNRIDNFLFLLSVGLEAQISFDKVNRTAGHGDGHRHDLLIQADLLQRMNASRRHGHIDRPSRTCRRRSHIGASFVYFYAKTPLREEYGQQRAYEAGADEGDGGTGEW